MAEQKTELKVKETKEKNEGTKEAVEQPKEAVEKLEDDVKDKSPKADVKKKPKEEKTGIAYIRSSSNNTIVHITDLAGSTISRVSGGMITKHSRLKANPTIAMFVAKKAAERPKDLGFTKLYIRMKGKTRFSHGPGAHASVKTLGKSFDLVSILDTTKFPRGGPKKKGGRRGRRV